MKLKDIGFFLIAGLLIGAALTWLFAYIAAAGVKAALGGCP